jgi:non-specific serine/threonine protein kinase
MLETVREFAVERLEAQGPAATAVRRRHADYFTALAEEAGAALWDPVQGPNRAFWLDQLEADYGNLRAALAWADRHDSHIQLRIAAGLFDFWASRCYFEEGRTWLERALAQADGAASPARAKALHAAAFLALDQGDNARCNELGEESLELYRALGDAEGVGRTVHMLGQAAEAEGDRVRAVAFAEESLALARELGHTRGIIVSLVQLGGLAAQGGDHDRAAALLDEGSRLGEAHGDEMALASLRLEQSKLAYAAGRVEAASRHAVESIELFQAFGTTIGVAAGLRRLALLAEAQGRPERTALLFGAADALREAAGTPLPPDEDAVYVKALDRARAALGATAFAEAWAAGGALSPHEAVELASRDPAP